MRRPRSSEITGSVRSPNGLPSTNAARARAIASSGGRSRAMAARHHRADARATDPIDRQCRPRVIALVDAEVREAAGRAAAEHQSERGAVEDARQSREVRRARRRAGAGGNPGCVRRSQAPVPAGASRAAGMQRARVPAGPRARAAASSRRRLPGAARGIARLASRDQQHEVGVAHGDVRPRRRAGVGQVEHEAIARPPASASQSTSAGESLAPRRGPGSASPGLCAASRAVSTRTGPRCGERNGQGVPPGRVRPGRHRAAPGPPT